MFRVVAACATMAACTPPRAADRTAPASRSSGAPTTVATPPPGARSSEPPPDSATVHAPLEEDSPFIELPLSKGRPAVVSLPLGATSPRPVLVAAHGAGGLARTHCELWRSIVGDRGFVLCPRGSAIYPHGPPHATGYFYNGHPALGREIEVALAALGERYPERVDLDAPIFAGYSQGASMGSMVLPSHPARFARAVLWEGGFGQFQEWNIAAARRFRERGGLRVLLACGRVECLELARTTADYMRRGGLDARVVYESGAGHTHGGAIRHKVRAAFGWLTEGDSRW